MNSLKEVYRSLCETEKVAAQSQEQPAVEEHTEEEKIAMQQAVDYDTVGRILAHHVFDDMVKQAQAEAATYGHGPEKMHDDGAPCDTDCGGYDGAEKQASLRQGILRKMASDPAYTAQLIARHQHLLGQ